MALSDREQLLWYKVGGDREAEGTPAAVCSTITPFPFWAVIASMILFIPLALLVALFVKRQAIVVRAGRIIVLDLSFWRLRVSGEPLEVPVAAGIAERDGGKLLIDGRTYHLQPGWEDAADRLVALTGSGGWG